MIISLSAHRCLRKCQRQYFYRYLLASHSARDSLRHEAFILKQLTSLEAWAGNLVHRCLEEKVALSLSEGRAIDWRTAAEETIDRMHRQFEFSRARRYREPGVTKSREPDYCALLIHDSDQPTSLDALKEVEALLRKAFNNLPSLPEFWEHISGHLNYRSEDEFWLRFEGETIKVKLDLHYAHRQGHPVIVEWKCYNSMGGSDATPQLNLYAWALLQQPQWSRLAPERVELLEVRPLSGEVKRHPFNANSLVQIDDLLFEAVNEVRRVFGNGKYDEVDVTDLGFANSPGTCFFCPFREMCKGATDGTAPPNPVRDRKRGQLQLFVQAS